jgi:adenine/guanine phosphoribosyltransferase-like PRPP-binding protein
MNIILNQQEIAYKTRRMAYQIYETFPDETEVVIAGIASNGYVFAQLLATELEKDFRYYSNPVRGYYKQATTAGTHTNFITGCGLYQ